MKTKLTTTHDKLKLSIQDGKRKLNLTICRTRKSVSGTESGTLRMTMALFSNYLRKTGQLSYGTQMENLKTLAEASTSIEEFINKLV